MMHNRMQRDRFKEIVNGSHNALRKPGVIQDGDVEKVSSQAHFLAGERNIQWITEKEGFSNFGAF